MRDRQQDDTDEVTPMDPIALTLAVWLGLIVCITGLVHLSRNAADNAAIAQARRPVASSGIDGAALTMPALAFGS